ncbi:MAG TPA: hypothetical protein VLA93_20900 [Pyrinomonadaceae bacterium]|nr:hypothetical protein [Pyrinomonadaceae bacterium]
MSEVIARSDRGPLPKIKEMVKNLKVEHVTEEVSKALDHMNHEIIKVSSEVQAKQDRRWSLRRKKTAAERRERQLTKGIVSLFSGTGLTIFLYYLSAALVLKLPPHIIQQIPFEIDPVVRVLWLVGLIPTLSGFGHILSGLLIRPDPELHPQQVSFPASEVETPSPPRIETPIPQRVEASTTVTAPTSPASVTERTTNLLDRVS